MLHGTSTHVALTHVIDILPSVLPAQCTINVLTKSTKMSITNYE